MRTFHVLALLILLAPLPCGADELTASIESTGKPGLTGVIELKEGAVQVTDAAGKIHLIRPEDLIEARFKSPRLPLDSAPFKDGDLPAPWKQQLVGNLPRGGSVSVSNGSIIIEASAPPTDQEFDAFVGALRPLPEGDCQITARVSRIDNYDEDTRGGLIIRDGTGTEANNIYLSLSHRGRLAMRHWKSKGGTTKTDKRSKTRPGDWLRLIRKDGRITGYTSDNGGFWREIWSVEDKMEGEVFGGIIASGRKPRRRWSTVFDHLEITSVEQLGELWPLRPRVALTDGTIFNSEIASATEKLLRLGAPHARRVVPLINVARIEFYHPLPDEVDRKLAGATAGVLLEGEDFFEGKLASIADGKLTAQSSLFGRREFDLRGGVDALVLRPASAKPPAGHPLLVETWGGGRIYARAITVAENHFVLQTLRLGKLKVRPRDVFKLSKIRKED